jgi:hypothetical protein
MLSAGTASSGIVVRRTSPMRMGERSIIRVTVYTLALDDNVERRALRLVRVRGVSRKRRLIRAGTGRASHRAPQQRSHRDLGRRQRRVRASFYPSDLLLTKGSSFQIRAPKGKAQTKRAVIDLSDDDDEDGSDKCVSFAISLRSVADRVQRCPGLPRGSPGRTRA